MKLYYLDHSGFALDDGKRCYIFDYYRDPAGRVTELQAQGRELWFFVSHWHGDHYVPAIADFQTETTRYIVHEDVPQHLLNPAQTTVMAVGDTKTMADVTIRMYGSTDEGGSFCVTTPTRTIFHAGDLNWWAWLGDTPANQEEARQMMLAAFAPLDGLTVDVAMFPVDARLEAAREWGVIEFLHRVTVTEMLVPMHANGPVWEPSLYMNARFPDVPRWIPTTTGEGKNLHG